MKKSLLIFILIILTVSQASAYETTVTLDPDESEPMEIPVGGSGVYDIIVCTDHVGPATLHYKAPGTELFGTITDGIISNPSGENVKLDFYSNPGNPIECQHFDMIIEPQDGIDPVPQTIYFNVDFNRKQSASGVVKVEGATNVTPELSTIVLMSVGLLGMLGLTRIKKCD